MYIILLLIALAFLYVALDYHYRLNLNDAITMFVKVENYCLPIDNNPDYLSLVEYIPSPSLSNTERRTRKTTINFKPNVTIFQKSLVTRIHNEFAEFVPFREDGMRALRASDEYLVIMYNYSQLAQWFWTKEVIRKNTSVLRYCDDVIMVRNVSLCAGSIFLGFAILF